MMGASLGEIQGDKCVGMLDMFAKVEDVTWALPKVILYKAHK